MNSGEKELDVPCTRGTADSSTPPREGMTVCRVRDMLYIICGLLYLKLSLGDLETLCSLSHSVYLALFNLACGIPYKFVN